MYTEDGVGIRIKMNRQYMPCSGSSFAVEPGLYEIMVVVDHPNQKFKHKDSWLKCTLFCDEKEMSTLFCAEKETSCLVQRSADLPNTFLFHSAFSADSNWQQVPMQFGRTDIEVDSKFQSVSSNAGKIRVYLQESRRVQSSSTSTKYSPAVVRAPTPDLKPAEYPSLCVQLEEPAIKHTWQQDGYQQTVSAKYDCISHQELRRKVNTLIQSNELTLPRLSVASYNLAGCRATGEIRKA